jgi:hypothetical protein
VGAPIFYIPVQGTWGWDEDPKNILWWEQGSPFTERLRTLGLIQLPSKRAFLWSTELEGFQVWERLLHTPGHKHRIWKAAGLSLCYFLENDLGAIPYYNRNLIAHSHGLQVILYACGLYGLRIRNLISVGSPIRQDMQEITLKALPNIGNWAHIYDPKKDEVGEAGEFNDGRFRWPWQKRLSPLADKLIPVPGAGHSGTLNDSKFFSVWDENQDFLRLNGPNPRAIITS